MIFGFGAFLQFGVLLVLVGAYQPSLAKDLGVGLPEIGLLGASVVLGIGIGVFAGGPLVDRGSGRTLFVGASLTTAAALLSVSESMGVPRAFVHLLVAGIGAGLYETVINSSAVARYGDEAVRRLAVLHSAATLGAMLAPLAIGMSSADEGGFVLGFRAIGGAHLALAAWSFITPALSVDAANGETDVVIDSSVPTPLDLIARRDIQLLALAAFFYVGIETSVTVFSIPYAVETLGLGVERGRAAITAFWLGLLVARLAVPFMPRSLGARTLIRSGLLASAGLGLSVGLHSSWIEAATAFTGLALGAVFPLLVALSGTAGGSGRGTSIALVVGLGSVGGFVLPFGLGLVADAAGTAMAFMLMSAGCGVIALVGVRLRVVPRV